MPQSIYMPIFCSSTDSFATFCVFTFSGLFPRFGLPCILLFICMLFFCLSAAHSSASFEVDEQKTVFATFHFSLCIFLVVSTLWIAFYSIFHFLAVLLLISRSF